MRDSSHPRYMLTLSVKTRCGPTSVRIQYSEGTFWLDSISSSVPKLQSFPSVLSLIQHYRSPSGTEQDPHPEDKPDPDGGVPLRLTNPLHKPGVCPSLQHLARLVIHRHSNCSQKLPLPKPLLHYLQEYPFYI